MQAISESRNLRISGFQICPDLLSFVLIGLRLAKFSFDSFRLPLIDPDWFRLVRVGSDLFRFVSGSGWLRALDHGAEHLTLRLPARWCTTSGFVDASC